MHRLFAPDLFEKATFLPANRQVPTVRFDKATSSDAVGPASSHPVKPSLFYARASRKLAFTTMSRVRTYRPMRAKWLGPRTIGVFAMAGNNMATDAALQHAIFAPLLAALE